MTREYPETPTFLICHPKHYEVSYIINPWMHPDDWARERDQWKKKAETQWTSLRLTMQNIGWLMTEVQQVAGLPDMVFVADHAFTLENKALISYFATRERAPEAQHLKEWYATNGFETIDAQYMFEGGGDALYDPYYDVIFQGYGFRSSGLIAQQLRDIFKRQVLPLALKTPNFYHADTCFCPLKNGWAMLTRQAFTQDALDAIASIYGDKLIFVDDADATAFACNAVVYKNNIVMPKCSDKLTKQLEDMGLKTHQLQLDSFMISGGASRCLTHNLTE